MKSPCSSGLNVDGITTYSPGGREKRPQTSLLLINVGERAVDLLYRKKSFLITLSFATSSVSYIERKATLSNKQIKCNISTSCLAKNFMIMVLIKGMKKLPFYKP